MNRTTAEYLRDFLRELADVLSFTKEGESAFLDDVKTQKAVIRSYEVIGEICKRLPTELRDANAQIDWRQLITFRDFLAHNYETIVMRFVWNAVLDTPNLRSAIESMLASLPPEDEDEQS